MTETKAASTRDPLKDVLVLNKEAQINYSPSINYPIGYKVIYAGGIFKSRTSDNRGNNPVLSSEWVQLR